MPEPQLVKPFLVGIAGPSCAGKSLLAARLAASLNAQVLSLDSYYRDLSHLPPELRPFHNFDTPDSIDSDLLLQHLETLCRGLAISAPVYDFTRHERSSVTRLIKPEGVLILEGLFTLYWEQVRRLLSVKLFVQAPDEVCFARRLARDISERGRTPDSVKEQFYGTVLPMAARYVLPTAAFADLVLDGTRHPSEVELEALRLIAKQMP